MIAATLCVRSTTKWFITLNVLICWAAMWNFVVECACRNAPERACIFLEFIKIFSHTNLFAISLTISMAWCKCTMMMKKKKKNDNQFLNGGFCVVHKIHSKSIDNAVDFDGLNKPIMMDWTWIWSVWTYASYTWTKPQHSDVSQLHWNYDVNNAKDDAFHTQWRLTSKLQFMLFRTKCCWKTEREATNYFVFVFEHVRNRQALTVQKQQCNSRNLFHVKLIFLHIS